MKEALLFYLAVLVILFGVIKLSTVGVDTHSNSLTAVDQRGYIYQAPYERGIGRLICNRAFCE